MTGGGPGSYAKHPTPPRLVGHPYYSRAEYCKECLHFDSLSSLLQLGKQRLLPYALHSGEAFRPTLHRLLLNHATFYSLPLASEAQRRLFLLMEADVSLSTKEQLLGSHLQPTAQSTAEHSTSVFRVRSKAPSTALHSDHAFVDTLHSAVCIC